MELAGKVPENFVEDFKKATITLHLDGEMVLEKRPVAEFIGDLLQAPVSVTPFAFKGNYQSCLFTAHEMSDTFPEGRPVGYFLPRGTFVKALIEGIPRIPAGMEVRVGGVGSHYAPDAEVCPKTLGQ